MKRLSNVSIAIIGAVSLLVAIGFGRFLYTAILPDMLEQTSLGTVASGWLASSNYAGYIAGASIAMFVPLDKSWHSLTVGWGLIIMSSFFMFFDTPMLWYVWRFVAGLAGALMLINGSTLVLSFFSSEKRLFFSAVHYAGVGLGIMASAVLVICAKRVGISQYMVWLVAGVLSVALFALLWLLPKKPSLQYLKHKGHIASSADKRARILVMASYALSGFGYVTAATFLPVIFVDSIQQLQSSGGIVSVVGSQQFPAQLLLWFMVGVLAVFLPPLWGLLANKLGEFFILFLCFLLQAFAMALPVLVHELWAVSLSAFFLGVTFMAIVSLAMGAVRHLSGVQANLFLGLTTLGYGFGQFLGPIVTVSFFGSVLTIFGKPLYGFEAGLVFASVASICSAFTIMPILLYKSDVVKI